MDLLHEHDRGRGGLTRRKPRVRRGAGETRRSSKDPDNPAASARAISRASAGMFGNIIIGGGIDHSKGTAYTHPTWVQLVFGKTLVFDRTAEKNGLPTPATEAEAAPAAAASAAK